MKRAGRILIGIFVAHIGLFVTICMLLVTTNGPEDYAHHRDPLEFCKVDATVTSAKYADEEISFTLDVQSCNKKVNLHDHFVLSETGRSIAKKNGMPEPSNLVGSRIVIMTYPSGHLDRYINPIAALSVDGTEFLSFEDGYDALCSESKRLQMKDLFWAIVLPGGSIWFFSWATVRIIRGKREKPPRLPRFRFLRFQKLFPEN